MPTTKKKRQPRSLVDRGASPSPKKVAKKTKKSTKKKAIKKSAKKTSKKKGSKKGPPTPQDYLKQLRAMKGVEKEDFAMFSDEIVHSPIEEFISTGSLAIDRQIQGASGNGGGWPVGRISEVAAWEGVGKSTLLDMSLAQVQRMGGLGVMIDTEASRDPVYTRMLGVNTDDVLASDCRTVEDVFHHIEQVLTIQEKIKHEQGTVPPMLIIWDSLGGTPSKAELDGEAKDKHVASAAKVIKQNFRRLTQKISDLRVALVVANHFYEKIGGFGGRAAYGGSGVKYFTSLRLWLTRTGKITIGSDVVGHTIKAELKKTRISSPLPPIETALIYGAGIDNSYSIFEWAKSAMTPAGIPWIQQKTAHFWLYPPGEDPIHFQRKFLGLGQIFQERPDIYEMMASQFFKE